MNSKVGGVYMLKCKRETIRIGLWVAEIFDKKNGDALMVHTNIKAGIKKEV